MQKPWFVVESEGSVVNPSRVLGYCW